MLRVENVSFAYGNEMIIENLNLTVKPNHIVAILGDSGSGKSTLLRLIAGLERLKQGQIYLDDKNITGLAPEQRQVGMVFQDYALFPHLNVYDNVAYSLKNKKDNAFVHELLEITGIAKYKNKYPHQLSGGEKQRVALSRSICYKPKLLLLDEPFSNLDASLKQELRLKVKDILNHYHITTIIVTHDQLDAKVVAEEYYYMKKGKISSVDLSSHLQ